MSKPRKYCATRRVSYPLQVVDALVDVYAKSIYKRRIRPNSDKEHPQFLLMTSGHLGDALTLSYLFPLIYQSFPDCIIDVVAGKWCDPILVGNPYIRNLIHLNHAQTNRSRKSKLAKWREHVQTAKSAIKKLRKETYTASIDIRFSSAPMHFILPFISVGQTIGFGTRGLGGLLDHEFFLPDHEFHHLDLLLPLLQSINIDGKFDEIKPYFLFRDSARKTLLEKFPIIDNKHKPLILLCPESGQPEHFFSDIFWHKLTKEILVSTDCILVGCGQLTTTKELLASIKKDNPTYEANIIDTVGQLTIHELAALSEQANVAVTVDSLPAHLCSIFCPTVSFYKEGMGLQFFPLSNYPVLIFHDHVNSQHLSLSRNDFTSEYVNAFDDAVLVKSLKWIQAVLSTKKEVI